MHLCKFFLYYFTVFHHVAYIELTLNTLVRNRDITWLHLDFQIGFAELLLGIDRTNDTEILDNLIRNVLLPLVDVIQSDHLSVVINPDIHHSALRVGKGADGLQISPWSYRLELKNRASLSHGMRFLGPPCPAGPVNPPS